jgi:hypothetical protein
MIRLACSVLAIAAMPTLPGTVGAAPPAPCTCSAVRPIPYQVLYQHKDGTWLVPTLRAVRSARQWEAAMDEWQALQQVVGREPAPAIDWSHDAVIVLALGRQVRQCGVAVKGCQIESELTVLDLHLDLGPEQWDPIGTVEHPCVVISVANSDLRELRLRCDASIDGLPPGQDRRSEVSNGNDRMNAAPAAAAATAAGPAISSWGRIKAQYHGGTGD